MDAEQEELREQREKLDARQWKLNRQQEELRTQLTMQAAAYQRQFRSQPNVKAKINEELATIGPNPKEVHRPADGDKLDQILERLERLEKRLDHLERGKQ